MNKWLAVQCNYLKSKTFALDILQLYLTNMFLPKRRNSFQSTFELPGSTTTRGVTGVPFKTSCKFQIKIPSELSPLRMQLPCTSVEIVGAPGSVSELSTSPVCMLNTWRRLSPLITQSSCNVHDPWQMIVGCGVHPWQRFAVLVVYTQSSTSVRQDGVGVIKI